MSFIVPGQELDFVIYGHSNTNRLRLSGSQLQGRHKQQTTGIDGPDMTGYQRGIFDDSQVLKQNNLVRTLLTKVFSLNQYFDLYNKKTSNA
ncbi:hypothetical protein BG011_002169 [Mortierella polycephala]|uniref:Uncharacterized protein n=1 Tax=Mortierella polycephala TaxID=41804 RepID=A0A9P6Q3U0_9FUNG|nr:hypothetical protein BG011_002169 [Mortierella polycephala]